MPGLISNVPRRIAKFAALALCGLGSTGLAQESADKLPSGAGLAAKYTADKGITQHADVIFAENFEQGDYRQKWDEVRADQQDVLSLVDESSGGAPVGSRSLRVTATLDRNSGGGLTKWFEPADPVFIRFYVKFDENCDYVHHFCTLRANKSLQGGDRWSGFGGAGERPRGDERFSTALEPWGNWGRWTPPGRWNFYSYWHTMQPSPDGRHWGNAFRPDEQHDIPRGKWICAEFMLRHNTPGEDDGQQAYWIDGELKGHWNTINWRTSPTLWANALTLETYITDRWTKQKKNIVTFDNVVIARRYIGPAGAPESGATE
ncbi:MAG: hypothetical protein WDZ59_11700 [Pirellulales bacterium]